MIRLWNLLPARVRDTAARAAKTFVQVVIATTLAGLSGATSVSTVKALAFSALAAAVSVTWNTVVKPELP